MKLKHLAIFILVAALLVPIPALYASAHAAQWTVPTFSIVSVETDSTVTIHTYNFPADTTFTVRMGEFGTLAIGGTVVGSTDSGSGGSFKATYDIPDWLKGEAKIAIRMDATSGGWYAYNWFNNNTSSGPLPTPVPGYTGIPTFSIQNVDKDNSVTIKTYNFPADTTFTVRMGKYGTLGIGGTVVGSTDSGSGGSFKATYDIPDELKGKARIAIRMKATSGGYFAYNWFWNNTSNVTPGPTPTPGSVYTGIPTFSIQSVVRDNTVTIETNNFPSNETFTVRMGAFGTAGIGGTVVGTTDSGSGGSFTATYDIPSGLQGASQIAIWMDGPSGYFAYNWFWNYTTP
jgi:surface antigen